MQGNEFFIGAILAVLFFLLIAVFIIMFIVLYQKRHNRYIQEKQVLQSRFKQELLQTQIEIQEQTFKTISQEIHDNIGQALSLVKLNLNALPVMDQGLIKLTNSKGLVSKAIIDLRNLSRSMHGDRIAERGLQASLSDELRIIRNIGQIHTQLNTAGDNYRFDAQKEMILFRIAQEALNNALKYSKAKNIIISLDYQPGQFMLAVSDDGIGFDTASTQSGVTGIGLKSMQNRAELIGGKFLLRSSSEGGTTVSVSLQKGS